MVKASEGHPRSQFKSIANQGYIVFTLRPGASSWVLVPANDRWLWLGEDRARGSNCVGGVIKKFRFTQCKFHTQRLQIGLGDEMSETPRGQRHRKRAFAAGGINNQRAVSETLRGQGPHGRWGMFAVSHDRRPGAASRAESGCRSTDRYHRGIVFLCGYNVGYTHPS